MELAGRPTRLLERCSRLSAALEVEGERHRSILPCLPKRALLEVDGRRFRDEDRPSAFFVLVTRVGSPWGVTTVETPASWAEAFGNGRRSERKRESAPSGAVFEGIGVHLGFEGSQTPAGVCCDRQSEVASLGWSWSLRLHGVVGGRRAVWRRRRSRCPLMTRNCFFGLLWLTPVGFEEVASPCLRSVSSCCGCGSGCGNGRGIRRSVALFAQTFLLVGFTTVDVARGPLYTHINRVTLCLDT